MCPAADDLAHGDPLPDCDEVARYCTPGRYNRSEQKPRPTAFLWRRDKHGKPETDLSVYRLQHYDEPDNASALDLIRTEGARGLTLDKNGRFVMLNVGRAKAAAQSEGVSVDVIYTPRQEPLQPSHSSIMPRPTDYEEELRLATALSLLITRDDTFDAIQPSTDT